MNKPKTIRVAINRQTGKTRVLKDKPTVDVPLMDISEPPRTSTKTTLWEDLHRAQVPADIASGGHLLTQKRYDQKYNEVFERLERKFHTAFVELTYKHTELTHLDLAVICCALELVLPYPNLMDAIQNKIDKGIDWRDAVQKQVLSTLSLAGMPSNPDLEDQTYFKSLSFAVSNHLWEWHRIAYYKYINPKNLESVPAGAVVFIPVPQRNDETILREFVQEPRSEEVVSELEKRSKGKPCLAFIKEATANNFNLELSVDLLKTARKNGMVPRRVEGHLVFTVQEADIKNRVRHECPLCKGVALVRGTCPVCEHDFSEISIDQRKDIRMGLMYLQSIAGGFNIPSMVAARIQAYRAAPSVSGLVLEAQGMNVQIKTTLRATGTVPSLLLVDEPVIMAEVPTDDPFFGTFKKEG